MSESYRLRLEQIPPDQLYQPRTPCNIVPVLFVHAYNNSDYIARISEHGFPGFTDDGILFPFGHFGYPVSTGPHGYPNLPTLMEAIRQRKVRTLATPLPLGPNSFMEAFINALREQGIIVETDVEDDVGDDVQAGADDF